MASHWEDWELQEVSCACGWVGLLGDAKLDRDSMHVHYVDCPICDARLERLKVEASLEEIQRLADAGGQRAKDYLSAEKARQRVETTTHDINLENLEPLAVGDSPQVDGYLTLTPADWPNHAVLKRLSVWAEDRDSIHHLADAYSLELTSDYDRDWAHKVAFIYQNNVTGAWTEETAGISTIHGKRSATWYSCDPNGTRIDHKDVPVAFLIPVK